MITEIPLNRREKRSLNSKHFTSYTDTVSLPNRTEGITNKAWTQIKISSPNLDFISHQKGEEPNFTSIDISPHQSYQNLTFTLQIPKFPTFNTVPLPNYAKNNKNHQSNVDPNLKTTNLA